jgi:hypothetical protein
MFAVALLSLIAPAFAQAESIGVSNSAEPTQGVPMTIKASGVANGSDRLFVYVDELGRTCTTAPYASYGEYLTGSGGEALPVGSYTKQYTYTPTYVAFNSATYSVCGYLGPEEFGAPNATAEHTFEVRLPAASVAFEVSPNPITQNQSVSVTVSGGTEVARKLYVYVDNLGRSCGIDPGNESFGEPLANGQALSPGSYVEHYTYSPTYAGLAQNSYSLCGYVAPETFGAPDATGMASFTVISLQSIAEAEQHAAEAQAAKKAQEELQAKAKYEAEAPAREAAKRAAEAAKYAAQIAAAKRRAHETPVKHLSVNAADHSGHSSTDPGYTNLDITTSPYAHVVVKLSRYGHSTEHFEWGTHTTEVAEVIRWSCKSPGGTYRYVVTAKSDVGSTLTRRGDFTPVSVATCHRYEQREAEARTRHEREVLAGYEQEIREERERLHTYEANCRAEGGTPITLIVEGRPERYCRAPGGGLLPVPH